MLNLGIKNVLKLYIVETFFSFKMNSQSNPEYKKSINNTTIK